MSNKSLILFILACLVSFVSGKLFFRDNTEPLYNTVTGDPINCRAIIEANAKGFQDKHFTCEDAMHSIVRNCGADGYSW
jgi:hypothetical protein